MGTKLTDWPANVQEQIRAKLSGSREDGRCAASGALPASLHDPATGRAVEAFDEGAHECALTDAGKAEKALQREAMRWLEDHGWMILYHARTDKRTTARKGVSDIIALRRGNVLCAEAKVGKGKATAEQQRFLVDASAHAGFATVFRSISELEGFLRENRLL